MENESILIQAEAVLDSAAAVVLTPEANECLGCFVARQLYEFGCNGSHRFVSAYRDLAAPRATALVRRLARMGACCCDCEVFLNAYTLDFRYVTPGRWVADPVEGERWEEPAWPDPLPRCHGVRRGSTQPCAMWVRQ